MVARAAEMAVVGRAFLLAVRLADRTVYIQNDLADVGPDENWRLQLIEAAKSAYHDWRSIAIRREGLVSVVLADGSTERIPPPAERIPTAAVA